MSAKTVDPRERALLEVKRLIELGMRLDKHIGEMYDERAAAITAGSKDAAKMYKPAIQDAYAQRDSVAKKIGEMMIQYSAVDCGVGDSQPENGSRPPSSSNLDDSVEGIA